MALIGPGRRQLAALIKKTERIKDRKLTKLIVGDLQEELLDLTAERFRNADTPEGANWRPLVLRTGRPLRDRGMLANSYAILRASNKKIVIGSPMAYAQFHHFGTGIYGPNHKPITPKNAKALAFNVRGAKGTSKGKRGRKTKGFVFSSVNGTPPRRVLPLGDIPKSYEEAFDEVARERIDDWFSK